METEETTVRYHFTPIRMTRINKISYSKHRQGRGETGTLTHCLWGYKTVQPLRKTAWHCLKVLNTKLPCDPATYRTRKAGNVSPPNRYSHVHSISIHREWPQPNSHQLMDRFLKRDAPYNRILCGHKIGMK